MNSYTNLGIVYPLMDQSYVDDNYVDVIKKDGIKRPISLSDNHNIFHYSKELKL